MQHPVTDPLGFRLRIISTLVFTASLHPFQRWLTTTRLDTPTPVKTRVPTTGGSLCVLLRARRCLLHLGWLGPLVSARPIPSNTS